MKNFTMTGAVLCLFSVLVLGLADISLARAEEGPPGGGVSANGASGKASAKSGDKKSTDVNFEDLLVQGKYHFSDEAVTTVEDDKILDGLLGVRTDFKDRIKNSESRH